MVDRIIIVYRDIFNQLKGYKKTIIQLIGCLNY